VVDIPLHLTSNSSSFLFYIDLKKESDRRWSTFHQVRLTTQNQCPESNKIDDVGIYQVWPASTFNESMDSVRLTYQIPTNFSANSTRIFLGLVLQEQTLDLRGSFSIGVSIELIPLPPDYIPVWAILLTLCSSIVTLVFVGMICLWSRHNNADYLPIS